jgi:GT2 family glycosyltransferase
VRLSVVIPTRDRLEKLRQCVEALAKQGAAANEIEVVVADDGSTDGTRDWLESAARRSWPFALRGLPLQPRGPAAARNAGVCAASTDLVLFIGDDCVAAPGLLHGHLRAHAASGDEKSVLGHATWLPSLPVTPFMHFQENGGSQFAYGKIVDRKNAGWNFYYTTNVSTPRRVLCAQRFDERFPGARFEDMELGWRLTRSGHRIEYVREALCWHDHPVRFEDFRRRSVVYGEYAALFHRIHPDPALAHGLGIHDARTAISEHRAGLAAAERVVGMLEPLFPVYEPASDCFGVRGANGMLFDAYRLLIHHALVTGIRRGLDLPALPAASSRTTGEQPAQARPHPRAA